MVSIDVSGHFVPLPLQISKHFLFMLQLLYSLLSFLLDIFDFVYFVLIFDFFRWDVLLLLGNLVRNGLFVLIPFIFQSVELFLELTDLRLEDLHILATEFIKLWKNLTIFLRGFLLGLEGFSHLFLFFFNFLFFIEIFLNFDFVLVNLLFKSLISFDIFWNLFFTLLLKYFNIKIRVIFLFGCSWNTTLGHFSSCLSDNGLLKNLLVLNNCLRCWASCGNILGKSINHLRILNVLHVIHFRDLVITFANQLEQRLGFRRGSNGPGGRLALNGNLNGFLEAGQYLVLAHLLRLLVLVFLISWEVVVLLLSQNFLASGPCACVHLSSQRDATLVCCHMRLRPWSSEGIHHIEHSFNLLRLTVGNSLGIKISCNYDCISWTNKHWSLNLKKFWNDPWLCTEFREAALENNLISVGGLLGLIFILIIFKHNLK